MYQFVIAIVVIIVLQKFFSLLFGKKEEETKPTENNGDGAGAAAAGVDGDSAKPGSSTADKNTSSASATSGASSSSAVAATGAVGASSSSAEIDAAILSAALASRVENSEFSSAAERADAESKMAEAISSAVQSNFEAASSFKSTVLDSGDFQKAFDLSSNKKQKQFAERIKTALADMSDKNAVPPALLRSFVKDAARTLDAVVALAIYKSHIHSSSGGGGGGKNDHDDQHHHSATTTIGEKLEKEMARSGGSSNNKSLENASKLVMACKPMIDLVVWLLSEVLSTVHATCELRPVGSSDNGAATVLSADGTFKTSAITRFPLNSSSSSTATTKAAAPAAAALVQPKKPTLFAVLQTGAAVDTSFLSFGGGGSSSSSSPLLAPPGLTFEVAQTIPRSVLNIVGFEPQHHVAVLRHKQLLAEPCSEKNVLGANKKQENVPASFPFLTVEDLLAAHRALAPVFAPFLSELFVEPTVKVETVSLDEDSSSGSGSGGGATAADDNKKEKKLSEFFSPDKKDSSNDYSRDLYLTSDLGHGKTTSCVYAIASAAAGNNNNNSSRNIKSGSCCCLPVYIPVHRLSQKDVTSKGGIDDVIASTIGLTNSLLLAAAAQHICLFLDGMDETRVVDPTHWQRLPERNAAVMQSCQRVIVTCRNGWRPALPPRELLKGRCSDDGTVIDVATAELQPLAAAAVGAVYSNYCRFYQQQNQYALLGAAAAAAASSSSSSKDKNSSSSSSNKSSTFRLTEPLKKNGSPLIAFFAARLVTKTTTPANFDATIISKMVHPMNVLDAFLHSSLGAVPREAIGKLAQDVLRRNGYTTRMDGKKITGLPSLFSAATVHDAAPSQGKVGARELFCIEEDLLHPLDDTKATVSFLHRAIPEHFVGEICCAMGRSDVLHPLPPFISTFITKQLLEHHPSLTSGKVPQLREELMNRVVQVERDPHFVVSFLRKYIAQLEAMEQQGKLPDPRPKAFAYFNLSNTLMNVGEHAQAKETLNKTFVSVMNLFGPMSVQVGDVLFKLGCCYRQLEEPEQAKQKLLHAVRVRTQCHGEESGQVIETLWNLSRTHGALQEKTEQLEIAKKAVALCEKKFTKDELNYAFSLDCLAEAVGHSGDGQQMFMLLQQSLRIKEKVCQHPNHPVVVEGKNMIHNVLQQLQAAGALSPEDAMMAENSAFDGSGSLGSSHLTGSTETHTTPPSTPSNSPPSTLTPAQVDALKRKQTFEHELSQHLTRPGGDSSLAVADCLFNIGVAQSELDQFHDAAEKLVKARNIFRKHLGPKHPQIGWSMLYLATSLTATKRQEEAKSALAEARGILGEYAGAAKNCGSGGGEDECTHEMAASIFNDLGLAHLKLGDAAQATTLFKQALEADRTHNNGQDCAESATTMMHLADAHGLLGEHEKKAAMLEEVVSLREVFCGPHNAETADALVFLSKAYSAAGSDEKAEDAMKRAQKIFAKHRPVA